MPRTASRSTTPARRAATALALALGVAGAAGAADPAGMPSGQNVQKNANWAADAELEGIVDLLDPDYQHQPIKVARLPVQYAVKTVYGAGGRTLYTFEDPNCGYCRQLHQTLRDIGTRGGGLTVYTFVVSFLGEDSVRQANAVWCAKDRAAAWHRVMTKTAVAAARPGCAAPNAEVGRLLGLLGINLTPTVFYADGSRMNGVKPRAEVERRLAEATRAARAR